MSVIFLTIFILVRIAFNSAQIENTANPPHGCTNAGYCYPAYRTTNSANQIVCSNCTCPTGTTKTTETVCSSPSSCTPFPCPSSNWQCNLVGAKPTCTCAAGYATLDCSISSSSPCATYPCLGRGTCSNPPLSSTYTCACQTNTYGNQCQYDGDPCAGKCQNGGNCSLIDQNSQPVCNCPFGWVAANCDKAVTVKSSYTGCFDDSSFNYILNGYYLNSVASGTTGSSCFGQLTAYRKANPTSDYTFATVSGGSPAKCYFSNVQLQTKAPSCTGLLCGLLQALLSNCELGTPASGSASVYEAVDPCVSDPCNSAAGYGVCIPTGQTTYTCQCSKGRSGSSCLTVTALTPCASKSCGTGTCQTTDDGYGSYCQCPDGTNSVTACVTDPCVAAPCKNGGTCTSSGSNYTCACLNLYGGAVCEVFKSCYVNQCFNGGTCTEQPNLLDSTFLCNCTTGWRGARCETEVMPCDSSPCMNNAACSNVIGPPKDYKCNCTIGWEGKNCSVDIDECVTLGPNLCTKKDPAATCTNLLNGVYKCNCGTIWIGPTCSTNKIVYDILNATYGYVNDDDLEKLTEDLMNDPTIVRDLIPFLIGGYPLDTRTSLSWDYDDIFMWATYEQKLINVREDLVKWNDKVLGNCFTFNHVNSTHMYKGRVEGFLGGLELQTNIMEDEYLPWIETAAIMVFTHSWTESIFAESPRINCRGNHVVNLDLFPQSFARLGGKYGRCVEDKSEVASYYYGGSYTTDGCIRSCYQDVIKKGCGCMDPRYPMPEEEKSCGLSKRICIETIADDRGDPSKWPECTCPLPCDNMMFQVGWSEKRFRDKKINCDLVKGANRTSCMANENDMVLLKAGLPSLSTNTFIEMPAMDVLSFVSRMGGLLGVLMGISVISFIEFGMLFTQICIILTINKRMTVPTPRTKNLNIKKAHLGKTMSLP